MAPKLKRYKDFQVKHCSVDWPWQFWEKGPLRAEIRFPETALGPIKVDKENMYVTSPRHFFHFFSDYFLVFVQWLWYLTLRDLFYLLGVNAFQKRLGFTGSFDHKTQPSIHVHTVTFYLICRQVSGFPTQEHALSELTFKLKPPWGWNS